MDSTNKTIHDCISTSLCTESSNLTNFSLIAMHSNLICTFAQDIENVLKHRRFHVVGSTAIHSAIVSSPMITIVQDKGNV